MGRTEKVLCYQGISDGPIVVAVACHQDKTRLVDRGSIFLLRSQVGEGREAFGQVIRTEIHQAFRQLRSCSMAEK